MVLSTAQGRKHSGRKQWSLAATSGPGKGAGHDQANGP